LILIIGLVVFSSGLAGIFSLSALLLNTILGVGLINLPSHNHREMSKILHQQEKPIYIIFLVLAGAMWQPLSTNLVLLFACLILRFLGKWMGSGASATLWTISFKPPSNWGWALFPQGAMGIALVVDYLQYNSEPSVIAVLNLVIGTTLISQLLGPWLIQRTLQEVKP